MCFIALFGGNGLVVYIKRSTFSLLANWDWGTTVVAEQHSSCQLLGAATLIDGG